MDGSTETRADRAANRIQRELDAALEASTKQVQALLSFAVRTGFMLAVFPEKGHDVCWPRGIMPGVYDYAYKLWAAQCRRDSREPLTFGCRVVGAFKADEPLVGQLRRAWIAIPDRSAFNGAHMPLQMISDGKRTNKQPSKNMPVDALATSGRVEYRADNPDGAKAMFNTLRMPPVRDVLLCGNHHKRRTKAYG